MNNELTLKIRGNSRCDNILNASLWKGVVVALAINTRCKKYYCVRCIQLSNLGYHRTDEQLDNFVSKLMVVS